MQLLNRDKWITREDESKENFIARIKLQTKQLTDTIRIHGSCYIIKFGDEDIRPMWEDQISIKELKAEIRTPLETEWDCPLCQPYDQWTGLADVDLHRRYLCRVIAPKYKDGCIEDIGTFRKCACITKPKFRKRLKFKI